MFEGDSASEKLLGRSASINHRRAAAKRFDLTFSRSRLFPKQLSDSFYEDLPPEMEVDLISNAYGDDRSTVSTAEKYKKKDEDTFKQYLRVILPHVGLVLLLTMYTVAGASLFHLIELPHEVNERTSALREMQLTKEVFVQKLWNLSQIWNMDREHWRETAIKELEKIEEIVFDASKHKYVELEDLRNQSSMVWTFPQSIFFACTIITTIGYGHMVPLTLEGRVLSIVFGLFGIPLMLITIADIGKFLSDWITIIYRTYRAFRLKVKRQGRSLGYFRANKSTHSSADSSSDSSESEQPSVPWWLVLLFLALYTALGGVLFMHLERWTYFESCYFCFITMATIGFGDYVPSEETYMFVTLLYIVIGLSITTMCIDLAGTEYIRKIHYFGQRIENAKVAVEDALQFGEDFLEHVRLAGGKLDLFKNRDVLPEDLQELAQNMPPGQSFDASALLQIYHRRLMAGDTERGVLHNILWEPLSPEVRKHLKNKNIKVLPDEIKEGDAFILQNKVFEKPVFGPDGLFTRERNEEIVASKMRTWPRKTRSEPNDTSLMIAPFLVKESDV